MSQLVESEPRLSDLSEEQQKRRGDWHCQQGADHAEQRTAEQGSDHHEGAGNVHRLLEDPRLKDVVLELLIGDVEDQGGDSDSR